MKAGEKKLSEKFKSTFQNFKQFKQEKRVWS